MSVEFNLLYRWHATISTTDEVWTEDLMRKIFPDQSWKSITTTEFRQRVQDLRLGATAASETGVNGTPAAPFIQPNSTGSTSNGSTSSGAKGSASSTAPPSTWTFNGLQRDPQTGRFDDDALANILQNATETAAQSFRARGTPDVMRVVEMLAIEQSRSWGVCTLNEFRKFLGLKGRCFVSHVMFPHLYSCKRAISLHILRGMEP